MTREEFSDHLSKAALPAELIPELCVLWLDKKGAWDAAHELAQDLDSPSGARLHAYLHRKEGDLENARYWYRRAGLAQFEGSLVAEWETLLRDFCRS
jgi:hypothetical protein